MPRALRTLGLSFHETRLTHFGGLVLLQRFCNKLGLRRLLQRSLRMPRRNANYTTADLILALWYAIRAGLRRIKQDRDSAVQRYLPVLAGPLAVPRPLHLAPFLQRMSTRSVRRSSACTINCALNALLYPDGELPSPSI